MIKFSIRIYVVFSSTLIYPKIPIISLFVFKLSATLANITTAFATCCLRRTVRPRCHSLPRHCRLSASGSRGFPLFLIYQKTPPFETNKLRLLLGIVPHFQFGNYGFQMISGQVFWRKEYN